MTFTGVDTKEELALLLAIRIQDIDGVISRIDRFYRTKKEPKKNGGHRILRIPNGRLKNLQKKIVTMILSKIEFPGQVHGGVARTSVKTAIEKHVRKSVVTSFDIRDCFPSIRPERVKKGFSLLGFGEEAAAILTRLTTVDFQLPQGAPTSTMLANLCLLKLDYRLKGVARQQAFTYTRYIDDVIISGGKRVPKFNRLMSRITQTEGFQMKESNGATIRNMPNAGPQKVLGVTINWKLNVNKERRSEIRAKAIQTVSGESPTTIVSALGQLGWVGYINKDASKRVRKRLKEMNQG